MSALLTRLDSVRQITVFALLFAVVMVLSSCGDEVGRETPSAGSPVSEATEPPPQGSASVPTERPTAAAEERPTDPGIGRPIPPVPDAKEWCSPPPAGRPSPMPPVPDIVGAVLFNDESMVGWVGVNTATVSLYDSSGLVATTVTGPCEWDSSVDGVFTFDGLPPGPTTYEIRVARGGLETPNLAGTIPYSDPDGVMTVDQAFVGVPSSGLCTEAVFSYVQ